jgi:hypothetical protein
MATLIKTMTELRNDLPPLPERIMKLPVDPKRGYPVPFFVQWLKEENGKLIACPAGEGEPDFRITDPEALVTCLWDNVCWTCGEKLGLFRAYLLGPQAALQRMSHEPPSHVECAKFAVKSCPFMVNPEMKRREDETTRSILTDEHSIIENPGITVLWVVKEPDGATVTKQINEPTLFHLGNPVEVTWWKEGREATSKETTVAIETAVGRLIAGLNKRAREKIILKGHELMARKKP